MNEPLPLIELALKETERLTKIGFDPLIIALDIGDVAFDHGMVRHEVLYQYLKANDCATELLNEKLELISLPLAQFLTLGASIYKDSPNINNLEDVKQHLKKHIAHVALFSQWGERSKAIIYLCYFSNLRWQDFAATSAHTVAEFHILEYSLRYCEINFDEISTFSHRVQERYKHSGGLHNLGESVYQKLLHDRNLAEEFRRRIGEVLADQVLRQLLPGILKGITKEDFDTFTAFFPDMLRSFDEDQLYDMLIGWSVACPSDDQSKTFLKLQLHYYYQHGKLSPAGYLQALTLAKFKDGEVLAHLKNRAESAEDEQEQLQVINFLLANLNDHEAIWFRDAALAVVKKPGKQLIGILEHFLLLLIETDVNLVYQLISMRFSILGSKSFLKEVWYSLATKDETRFQNELTKWFHSRSANVHRAMLSLTSVRDLEDKHFNLSQEILKELSEGDKLFIGLKIAGFVYDKDRLQSLFFSLIRSIKPKEKDFMQELFNVMFGYVVYNYRSVLDDVKNLLKGRGLTATERSFYRLLDREYELYFEGLRSIGNHPEMRPDRQLVQHLQFYTQQKFQEEFKKAPIPAWADFGKTVTVHSNRWAVRRKGEAKHHPEPLAHIETSTEFPSGERLNPVHQELLRRQYQKITRDAININ